MTQANSRVCNQGYRHTVIGSCVSKVRDRLQSRHLPWQLAAPAMLLCGPALRPGWQSESAAGDALRELLGTLTCPQVSHSNGREIMRLVRTPSPCATVLSKVMKAIETTGGMR